MPWGAKRAAREVWEHTLAKKFLRPEKQFSISLLSVSELSCGNLSKYFMIRRPHFKLSPSSCPLFRYTIKFKAECLWRRLIYKIKIDN